MTTRLSPDLLRASPEQGPPAGCPEASADYRLTPHYRFQSTLDRFLSQIHPGHDAYISELYAEEVATALAKWTAALCQNPLSLSPIVELLSPELAATSLRPEAEQCLRNKASLQVWRGQFQGQSTLQRETFVQELGLFFGSSWRLRTAQFEVASITIKQEVPLIFSTRIRYDLVGPTSGEDTEERIGFWDLEWERRTSGSLAIRTWRSGEETRCRVAGRVFEDVTTWALGGNT